MTPNTLNTSACSHCSFIAFCQASILTHDNYQENSLVVVKRKLKRNEVLCMRTHKFQSLFAIEEGAIKAYQVDSHGREHIKSFYFAGEVLDYRAIHTGFYISSLVALKDTVVCEMPYNRFLDLLKVNPALHQQILTLISRQLSVGSYVDASSAQQRIAAFLIDISQRIKTNLTMQSFKLPMTRQDIGNYLGLTAETVSRVFTYLQNEGVLVINGKLIRITNASKLCDLAE